MREIFEDIDVADVDTDGIGDGVTGATFTLLIGNMPDGLAHQISILNNTANSHAAKTMAIVGIDADGRLQSETIAGPAGSVAVESLKYYKSITSITPSATIGADTFDIGWVDETASRSIFLEQYAGIPPLVQFNITGTLNLTIEVTISPREHFALDSPWPVVWQPTGHNGLVNATANSVSPDEIESGLTACRIVLNSYSSGAEVQVVIADPDSVA